MNSIESCQGIKKGLEEKNIGYGDPTNESGCLWRISPQYFLLTEKQRLGIEQAVAAFVNFYLAVEKPTEPWYFRLDATINHEHKPIITEWNMAPVGEAGVAINRGLYNFLLPMPIGCYNPFPGNLAVLAKALKWYGNATMAIIIPQNRRKYTRDYLRTAMLLRELGLNVAVQDDLESIDVILRIFPKEALSKPDILPGGKEILSALERGKVKIFPRFSPLETKESMAWIFNSASLTAEVLEVAERLRQFIPWTWPTDRTTTPKKGYQNLSWWAYFMGEEMRRAGFLLKPCESFGGRGIVFSQEVKMKSWREALGSALTAWPAQKTIIQEKAHLREFSAAYLVGDQIVESNGWKVRLCITGIWIPEQGFEVGDVDATLCQGMSLVHQQADCVFVPTVVKKGKKA